MTDLTPAVRALLVAISNRDPDVRIALTPGEAADILAALDAERARNRDLEAVAEAARTLMNGALGYSDRTAYETLSAALAVLEEPPA